MQGGDEDESNERTVISSFSRCIRYHEQKITFRRTKELEAKKSVFDLSPAESTCNKAKI